MKYPLHLLMDYGLTDWLATWPIGAATAALSGWAWLLLGVLVGAGVGFGGWIAIRVRRNSSSDNSRALFRELCRAHELSRAERRLLSGLAMHLRLKAPCLLFIDSNLWELPNASEQENVVSELNWGKLRKLQRVLFSPTFIQ